MPVQRLTDPTISRLTAPPGERVDYTDDRFPGLAIRVSGAADQRASRRTWTLTYRIDGAQRRMTLGAHPSMSLAQARGAGDAALAQVRGGIDPQAAKASAEAAVKAAAREAAARESGTVAALTERYIGHLRQRKRSARYVAETHANIVNHVLSRWGSRDVRTIARRDLIELLEEIASKGSTVMGADGRQRHLPGGEVVSNRVRNAIRAMFVFGADENDEDDELARALAPIQRVKPQYVETARDRVLTAHEIRALWSGFTEMGYPYGDALKVLLLLGQRLNEVAKMEWADVDQQEGLWTIPAANTKARRLTIVPLPPLVTDIIAGLPKLGPHVFTGATGRAISGYSSAKNRLTEITGSDVAPWTFHDLRRTCATELGRLGIDEEIISKILNHAPKGVTAKVYNRFTYLAQKRAALEKWTTYLADLTNPPATPNVADFAAERGRRQHAAVS